MESSKQLAKEFRSSAWKASRSRIPSTLVLPATRPQLKVLASPARFKAIFASRRFGKTTLGQLMILQKIKNANPLGLIWWVAPTYRQAARPFRQLLAVLRRANLLADVSRAGRSLRTVTGWTIEFRSADVEDNLRGEGVDFLIVDEFGQIADSTWNEALRPTLADTGGDFLGIGTPRGKIGWGYQMYLRGQRQESPDYQSFKFTVYDAAFIPPEEIEEARRSMPKRAFEQEFMAAFLDASGTVFEAVRGRPQLTPIAGEAVGIGVDWAKKVDNTWFVAVGAQSGAIIDVLKTRGFGYPAQVKMLKDFVERMEHGHSAVSICHDRTGVGEALDDLVAEAGMEAEGLVFTTKTKNDLIEEAVVDWEAGKLGIKRGMIETRPEIETLVQEHESFSLTVTKGGRIVYGAPDGMHDDAVIATALANRARRQLWRDEGEYGAVPMLDFIGDDGAEWRAWPGKPKLESGWGGYRVK